MGEERFHTDEPMPATLPEWTPFEKATLLTDPYWLASLTPEDRKSYERMVEHTVTNPDSRYLVRFLAAVEKSGAVRDMSPPNAG